MSGFLAVDPGLRHCGIAWFGQSGELLGCGLAQNPEQTERGANAWVKMAKVIVSMMFDKSHPRVLVYEMMKVRNRGEGAKNADDLLELTGVLGAIAAMWAPSHGRAVGYTPAEWKGQVRKEVHHARVFSNKGPLTPAETALLDASLAPIPQSLRHNVLDAVALGLFHTGRTRRGGSKA